MSPCHMPPSLDLRPLHLDDERSFMDALAEFRGEMPGFDFALGFERAANFGEYVVLLERWSRGIDLPHGYVPASFYVGIVQGAVVGRLSLRHSLNEYLRRIGGHIGYGVRPSERNRGYATEMLRRSLPLASALGIERALVTCDENNTGSRKVIEACGGVLENVIENPEGGPRKRRYWIATHGTTPSERLPG